MKKFKKKRIKNQIKDALIMSSLLISNDVHCAAATNDKSETLLLSHAPGNK